MTAGCTCAIVRTIAWRSSTSSASSSSSFPSSQAPAPTRRRSGFRPAPVPSGGEPAMTGRCRVPLAVGLIAAALAVGPLPAVAHEFSLESVMNGFVKLEPREAHLVVRVPLHVLKAVRFPLEGREIVLARADPDIHQALAVLGRDVSLFEGGHLLVPAGAVGRLSLPSDRSFDRYEDAVAHVSRVATAGASIYADHGYLDA